MMMAMAAPLKTSIAYSGAGGRKEDDPLPPRIAVSTQIHFTSFLVLFRYPHATFKGAICGGLPSQKQGTLEPGGRTIQMEQSPRLAPT